MFLFASLSPAASAEPEKQPPVVSTSLSVWESTGGSVWSHDASAVEPLFGDPTSRLDYDDVDSTIVELRVRAAFPEGIVAEVAYGAGDAEDGNLTDQDFVSARGADFFNTAIAGEHAYSETQSDLNGDAVRYVELSLGKKLYRSPDGESEIGMNGRYLHWTEEYRVRGVHQTVCTAPNRLCAPVGFSRFNQRDVVFNEAQWQALFVGVWGSHALTDRVSVSGELSYSPLATLKSDDRHFLRPDLAQSPSFRQEGDGQAATASINAAYRLTPQLTAGVGFRYWWMQVSDEARGLTIFPAGDEPFGVRLKQFETERYGVTASLVYTFQ